MTNSDPYVIPTDQNTISALAAPSSASLSFLVPKTAMLVQPNIELPVYGDLPPPPGVLQYDPPTDPEGTLAGLPGFGGGGPGGDLFAGQQGDEGGDYAGSGANANYNTVVAAMQGNPVWTVVGTDLNNGSQPQAVRDLITQLNIALGSYPIQTAPGNAALGFAKITAYGGACAIVATAAGIGAAAAYAAKSSKVVFAIMGTASAISVVKTCTALIANPDPDEIAAYDSILHAANYAAMHLSDEMGNGGVPQNVTSNAVGSATTSPTASISAAGWNLTATGGTVDFTKGYIDPTTHHAIYAVS